ncbi:MAG: GNAT family N-acetyltransferase [Armatimonadota bacterium]
MELIPYSDASAFRDDVLPFLLEREVENNLMISIIIRLADGTARWGDEPARLYLIRDGGEIVAAATQTPPYNLILTTAAPEITAFIADHLKDIPLPGVLGPKADADRFARLWQERTGRSAQLEMAERIYRLDRVDPPADVSGHAAAATLEDVELLVEWTNAFITESHASVSDPEAYVRGNIASRHLIVWKDPEPVSCASYGIPMPNGTRVGGVYTPPEYRRRGYATANVAAVSQRALDEGNKYCCLFTDLANPTSNSIYQKIGYRPVCDYAQYHFE